MVSRLILLRHGRAEQAGSEGDLSRGLTDVGRRQVAGVGRRIHQLGWWPDHAWVSHALRARQTHALLDPPIPATVDETLYEGERKDVLAGIASIPAETLAIVGHNPVLQEVAIHLTGLSVGLDPATAVLLRRVDATGRNERGWSLQELIHPF